MGVLWGYTQPPMSMKTLIAFISGMATATLAHKIIKSSQAKALAEKGKELGRKVEEIFRREMTKHLKEHPKE